MPSAKSPATSEIAALIRDPAARVHFVGIGGSGMSALAQVRAFGGGATSGSDRSFDLGLMNEERKCLDAIGVVLHPQDGRGTDGASLVVVSTAVEASIPDVARASESKIPIVHRSDLLAMHLDGPSVAIAGTSGKSTVTAMVFEILVAAGRDPGLITGGRLRRLMQEGHYGNAWRGKGARPGPLVVEADESDGSLVKHRPEHGVLLNLHRDHMEVEQVAEQFREFRHHVREQFVVSDEPELFEFQPGALVFGFSADADVRATDLVLERDAGRFRVDGREFRVAQPGLHNAWNALAALAAAKALGVSMDAAAEGLARFSGVHRRFEIVGAARGIEVIDDFAHNPQKVTAVLEAAKARSKRVVVWFQPHGFQPMRFFGKDLAAAFATSLRPDDRLCFAPIFFAGGTVAKDISSEDLIAAARAQGARHAEVVADRAAFVELVKREARDGDVVLVLGARDPSLPAYAREIAAAIASSSALP